MTNIVHATSDNRRDQLVRESQVGVWECPRRPAERFNSKDARRRSPTRQFHTSVTPKTDKLEIAGESALNEDRICFDATIYGSANK